MRLFEIDCAVHCEINSTLCFSNEHQECIQKKIIACLIHCSISVFPVITACQWQRITSKVENRWKSENYLLCLVAFSVKYSSFVHFDSFLPLFSIHSGGLPNPCCVVSSLAVRWILFLYCSLSTINSDNNHTRLSDGALLLHLNILQGELLCFQLNKPPPPLLIY